MITIIVCAVLIPLLFLSYLSRNRPGSALGPTVCLRCHVELRGWRSSGRKQVWHRTDGNGKKIYFWARCKNK